MPELMAMAKIIQQGVNAPPQNSLVYFSPISLDFIGANQICIFEGTCNITDVLNSRYTPFASKETMNLTFIIKPKIAKEPINLTIELIPSK